MWVGGLGKLGCRGWKGRNKNKEGKVVTNYVSFWKALRMFY